MDKIFWDFKEFRIPFNEKQNIDTELYTQISEFPAWYLKERNIELKEGETIMVTFVMSSDRMRTLKDFITDLVSTYKLNG